MNINKNNYEAFFLDYHEGTLSPQEVAELFLFLSQHPELRNEFEDFEHIVLEDLSATVFENKDLLKKNITADNREDYFIRAIENTLAPAELAELEQFLKLHPSYLTEFNLFKKTKLQVDTTIVFEDKLNLKQLTTADELFISALEGLLPAKEQARFEKQIADDPQLQKSFTLYQQTKLHADAAVIYPDKSSLKRKEKKVIPLYYYVAVAASIILVLGIFFLWRTGDNTTEQHFAEQKKQPAQKQTVIATEKPYASVKQNSTNQKRAPLNPVAVKPSHTNFKNNLSIEKNLVADKPVTEKTAEQPIVETPQPTDNSLAILKPVQEKENPVTTQDSSNLEQNKNTTPAIAKTEKKAETRIAPAYASIQDILSTKLKEKLMGKEDTEKETENTPKKLSGWDVAGALAKNLSKVTGKKIEVKPKYNSEGNVTAYALSAGKLEFSRVK